MIASQNLNSRAAITWIQREYSRRYENNPLYSLRAFARALGVSHAYLSLLLNGKRPISAPIAEKISQHICATQEERTEFWTAVRSPAASPGAPVPLDIETKERRQLDLDMFSLIAEWQHYAILSLLEIRKAKFDARWIAKRLCISEMQAKIAMERLVRLELVEEKRDGIWKQSGKPIAVENKVSTMATRKFHAQLLMKALESMENDPMEVRDFSSMTFAMNPKDIPYALEKIRKFRRALSEDLEKKSAAKEVYNLTVQLFPVSRSKSGGE